MTRSRCEDGLRDHPLIKELRTLGLDPDHFVVFGSGPLLAHGLRDISDLDLVARDSAWSRAEEIGKPTTGALSGDLMFRVGESGRIRVSRCWHPKIVDTDTLIDSAEIHDLIRFARLDYVRKYKLLLWREKDQKDLELMSSPRDGREGVIHW